MESMKTVLVHQASKLKEYKQARWLWRLERSYDEIKDMIEEEIGGHSKRSDEKRMATNIKMSRL